jgi:hypothetical protein
MKYSVLAALGLAMVSTQNIQVFQPEENEIQCITSSDNPIDNPAAVRCWECAKNERGTDTIDDRKPASDEEKKPTPTPDIPVAEEEEEAKDGLKYAKNKKFIGYWDCKLGYRFNGQETAQ